MKRSWLVLVMARCSLGVRALLLIATALWSDELYSVGKSFSPASAACWRCCGRTRIPPPTTPALALGAPGWPKPGQPAFAVLAGVSGRWPGDGPQAMALGHAGTGQGGGRCALGLCSPYPIRFAIEGKAMHCWCCWWPWPGGGAVRCVLWPMALWPGWPD